MHAPSDHPRFRSCRLSVCRPKRTRGTEQTQFSQHIHTDTINQAAATYKDRTVPTSRQSTLLVVSGQEEDTRRPQNTSNLQGKEPGQSLSTWASRGESHQQQPALQFGLQFGLSCVHMHAVRLAVALACVSAPDSSCVQLQHLTRAPPVLRCLHRPRRMLRWLSSKHRRTASNTSCHRVSLDILPGSGEVADAQVATAPIGASGGSKAARTSSASVVPVPTGNAQKSRGFNSLRRRSMPALHWQEPVDSAGMMSNPPVFDNPLRRRGCCDHQHTEQVSHRTSAAVQPGNNFQMCS